MPSTDPREPSIAAPAADAVRPDRSRFDAAAMCSCHTSSLPTPGGGITLVRVYGDVDLNTHHVLRSALAEAVRRRSAHLVVDLAGIRFCSVRGLSLLAQAPAGPPPHYALSGVSPRVERVLGLLGPPGTLPVRHPSARAAVLAALAHEHRQPADDHPAPRPAPPRTPWVWDRDDRFRDVDDELAVRARDDDAHREVAGRHRTGIHRSTLRMPGAPDDPDEIAEDLAARLRTALTASGAVDPS